MNSSSAIDRRDFLAKSLAAGFCLGCALAPAASASARELSKDAAPPAAPATPPRSSGSAGPGMTYEQVFNFAFRDHSILYLLAIANKIGRENLVEMLKSTTDGLPFREGYARRIKQDLPTDFIDQVLHQETLELTEKVRVQKVTRCLWAETYRAADAADIGYAMWCYDDYASAHSRGMKLERNRTLMQGHDCCLLKWTKES